MNKKILILLFQLICLGISSSDSPLPNWKQEKGVYEVYGITLEKFFELHPITLVLLYDDSRLSSQTVEMLPELFQEFSENQINVVVAKMRKTDGPRWYHHWKAQHLPYFRLHVGENVSVTLRAFPDQENVFNWVSEIYKNQRRVYEIKNQEIKKRFHSEPNAFYLRFSPKKDNYYQMLTKLQMVSLDVQIYYSTNPAFDVFDNSKADEVVIGFKRNFDDKLKFLSSADKLNSDNIQRFFHSYKEPIVNHLSEDLLNKIMTDRIRSAFFFGSDSSSSVLEAFKFVGFEQKPNILFVLVDTKDKFAEEVRKYMHVSEKQENEMRIIEHDGDDFRVYVIQGRTVSEIVSEFDKFNKNELPEIHERDHIIDDIHAEL